MKRYLAMMLMTVVACAGQEEQIQQGVTDVPCMGDNCPPPGGGSSPACPATPPVRSVGTYWPKVVGYNNANPPTQVIFASATTGFTCGGESIPPGGALAPPNSPRPWEYPITNWRRYPVCSYCAGGWQPHQAFPAYSKTSYQTYAQQTAQACVKMCEGANYCDSYQREDLQWQCQAGPGSTSCHTW